MTLVEEISCIVLFTLWLSSLHWNIRGSFASMIFPEHILGFLVEYINLFFKDVKYGHIVLAANLGVDVHKANLGYKNVAHEKGQELEHKYANEHVYRKFVLVGRPVDYVLGHLHCGIDQVTCDEAAPKVAVEETKDD